MNEKENLDDAKTDLLKDELSDYELEQEDIDLLDVDLVDSPDSGYQVAPPVLAIVGRPNVGKSALVNRILGRREAVVEDKPGVTRDRVTYKAEWNGKNITLVDTGGWEIDAKGIDASVAAQAEVAVELSDGVLFVVDAMVGPTASDERVVQMLRASGKPVILVQTRLMISTWSLRLQLSGRWVLAIRSRFQHSTAAALPTC